MRISPAGFAARTENEACRLSKAVTEVTHNHEEGIKGAESVSFEDAIRNAISIGGDSDILAAITGSIAEAYYGVPEELKEIALSYLDTELRSIYDEWCEFMGNGGKIEQAFNVFEDGYILKWLKRLKAIDEGDSKAAPIVLFRKKGIPNLMIICESV